MADKTTKLTAPNGAKVSVAQGRVENLLRYGFTEIKAAAKKASSSKSDKK